MTCQYAVVVFLFWLCTAKVVTASFVSMGTLFAVAVPRILKPDKNSNPTLTFHVSTWSVTDIKVQLEASSQGNESQLKASIELSRNSPAFYTVNEKHLSEVDVGIKGSYVLRGTERFGLCVLIKESRQSADTIQVLPVEAWGKEYIAVTSWRNPSIQVISSADDNRIRFRLVIRADIFFQTIMYNGTGYTSNTALFAILQRFQTFAFGSCSLTSVQNAILTGTEIYGQLPIGVVSGNCATHIRTSRCSYMQLDDGRSLDVVAEMLFPTSHCGYEFIVATPHMRKFLGTVDIQAKEDLTTVIVSTDNHGGLANYTLYNLGNDWIPAKKAFKIVSNKKICVILRQSSACLNAKLEPMEELGDPSLSLVVPTSLFAVAYVWRTPDIKAQHFAILVTKYRFVHTLVLDDERIDTTTRWMEVFGERSYRVGHLDIKGDCHTLMSRAKHAFGLYLYGLAYRMSYMHPAGFQNCSMTNERNQTEDFLDNDCDGRVDEEVPNNKDDDGDGRIDEDIRQPPTVDGEWGTWAEWYCHDDCAKRVLTRKRPCDNPEPANGGHYCRGKYQEMSYTKCITAAVCPGGCQNFTWGVKCDKSCQNCADYCETETGVCGHCKKGFKHPTTTCQTGCSIDEYGLECEGVCSMKCYGFDCIDRVTGKCPTEAVIAVFVTTVAFVVFIVLICCYQKLKIPTSQPRADGTPRANVPGEAGHSGRDGGQSGPDGGQSGRDGGQSGRDGGQSGRDSAQSGRDGVHGGRDGGHGGREGGHGGRDSGQSGRDVVPTDLAHRSNSDQNRAASVAGTQ